MDELAPVAHGGLMHARPRIAPMRGLVRILCVLSILAVACDGRPSVPKAGKGLKPNDFEFYLDAFKYGMPTHGGFGMGVDRLTQTILQLDNIREAVLFPRDPERVEP